MASFFLQPNFPQDVLIVLGQIFPNDPFLNIARNPELFLYDLFELAEGGRLRHLEGDWAVVRRLVFHVEGNPEEQKMIHAVSDR